jgi:hypothetical protein
MIVVEAAKDIIRNTGYRIALVYLNTKILFYLFSCICVTEKTMIPIETSRQKYAIIILSSSPRISF